MIDYNIINISQVKIDHLSEFYKKAFNKRHITLIKHWKWWYRNNYLGYEPLILLNKSEIIGQAGLIPVKIKVENKSKPNLSVQVEHSAYLNSGLLKFFHSSFENLFL